MISEDTPVRIPAGHAGLLENLLALVSALAAFFESALLCCPGIQSGRSASADIASCLILRCALRLGYIFSCVASWLWHRWDHAMGYPCPSEYIPNCTRFTSGRAQRITTVFRATLTVITEGSRMAEKSGRNKSIDDVDGRNRAVCQRVRRDCAACSTLDFRLSSQIISTKTVPG